MNKLVMIVVLSIFTTISISAQKLKYGEKYTKSKKAASSQSSSGKGVGITNKGIGTADNARKFADRMANASGRYVFLQTKNGSSSDKIVYRYVLSSVQDKSAYITATSCKECMDIEFKKDMGKNTYSFYHVWGNFSDLFPAWKALFKPNAQQSDYMVSDQNILVEWKGAYGNQPAIFGRLGTAWYIKM